MFHIALFIRKHEMIVYAQSGMEFHREEKDEGEILQLGQFHMISFFSQPGLILPSICDI